MSQIVYKDNSKPNAKRCEEKLDIIGETLQNHYIFLNITDAFMETLTEVLHNAGILDRDEFSKQVEENFDARIEEADSARKAAVSDEVVGVHARLSSERGDQEDGTTEEVEAEVL